jgi:hypothetical protein
VLIDPHVDPTEGIIGVSSGGGGLPCRVRYCSDCTGRSAALETIEFSLKALSVLIPALGLLGFLMEALFCGAEAAPHRAEGALGVVCAIPLDPCKLELRRRGSIGVGRSARDWSGLGRRNLRLAREVLGGVCAAVLVGPEAQVRALEVAASLEGAVGIALAATFGRDRLDGRPLDRIGTSVVLAG